MSYFLIDANMQTRDFATNAGLRELEGLGLPALNEFLELGVADGDLAGRIRDEVRELPETKYIATLLDLLEPPIKLSDGVIEEAEAEVENERPKRKVKNVSVIRDPQTGKITGG